MALLFIHGLAAKIATLIIFSIASFTDWVDGYLARKYNEVSAFGKFMDPIADKILVLSAFFAFIELKLVPAWMVVIIVLRESVVTGLRLLALTKNIILPAQEGGKQKTASQMIAIFIILISLILNEAGMQFPSEAIYILMLITTALTLISGSSFLYRNRAILMANHR
jgi:CDP-diacylglycerol--glycerol-3-phosphate 3-phosphatidyltransferase